MGRFIEFAEVLEQKIRREVENEYSQRENARFSSEKSSLNAEFPSEFDEWPLGFAWILGQGPALKVQPRPETTAHKAYGVKVRPPTPHKLSAEQTRAFDLFTAWNTGLDPAFRAGDLRRAWRKAALATHPDHGGTAESFRQAQGAYQVLQSVLLAKVTV
ncbi:MAG: J domain-containing protein [Bdellovibrionaceae bacterium]|nr:J domain-containing protein [Pseudobdellovibrionaceae bacterium]